MKKILLLLILTFLINCTGAAFSAGSDAAQKEEDKDKKPYCDMLKLVFLNKKGFGSLLEFVQYIRGLLDLGMSNSDCLTTLILFPSTSGNPSSNTSTGTTITTNNLKCSLGTDLSFNTSVSNTVSTGNYAYYRYTATSSNNYTIALTVSTGDQDLYINKNTTTCPTISTFFDSSAFSGSDGISTFLSTGDSVNIGIRGATGGSFSIKVN